VAAERCSGDDRGVTVHTTTDTAEILDRLDQALMAEPVRNTIFATVRGVLRAAQEGGWCAFNAVALAARSAPGDPVALTSGWSDLSGLTAALRELPTLSGLGGPVHTVEAVIASLDRRPRTRIVERLYRLDRLSRPQDVAGTARLAQEEDIALVRGWVEPFTVEAFGALPDGFDPERLARAAIGYSRTWLWFDPAGVPVSMATRRPPAGGVSRIGPVYTPPEHRGHGYGSAVTAQAAFDIIDSASVPVLYADAGNGTSNKIYRAIGYEPVNDVDEWEFD
jgi:GNAT superfamily N-acetyltransferase